MRAVIADTGPLIALLNRAERSHAWVAEMMSSLDAPLLVCEAVLTESMHLLNRFPLAQDGLLECLEDGVLRVAFDVEDHVREIRALRHKYRDRPMSFADACVVRMAEIHERHAVFTLDADFTVYRKNGRAPLALLMPPKV